MLATINFNDDPGRITEKVGDIGADRALAAEMEAVMFHVPQIDSELALCIRLVSPQITCTLIGHCIGILARNELRHIFTSPSR